jgi:dTDP-4-dehydrorhamnose reductase
MRLVARKHAADYRTRNDRVASLANRRHAFLSEFADFPREGKQRALIYEQMGEPLSLVLISRRARKVAEPESNSHVHARSGRSHGSVYGCISSIIIVNLDARGQPAANRVSFYNDICCGAAI